MKYCTSCGNPIPENQGNSCSMCYGDVNFGSDGYYQEFMEEHARQAQEQEWENQQQELREDF